jgi:hypothetical protein
MDKESLDQLRKDIIDYDIDVQGSLYETEEVEELYLENDGKLTGFIQVGQVGVAIDIPFEVWFEEFKKHKAFDVLRTKLEALILENETTLQELKNMFAYHCSNQSRISENDE